MKKGNWILGLVIVLVLTVTACNTGVLPPALAPAKTPESIVRLVSDGDNVRDIRTVSHGLGGYDDVYLEPGMAAAQILCGITQNISSGSATALNASEITVEECPELLSGVKAQIVNTITAYGFECKNCAIIFDGSWEFGYGVKVWRGTIKITPTSSEAPSIVLYPLIHP